MQKTLIPVLMLILTACAQTPAGDATPVAMPAVADKARLAAVLAAQPEETRARYRYRNPQQTLEFFGVAPGMTVVEGLPGGGWYSKILLDYLGPDGRLIGADYALDMFPKFGFFTAEQLEAKKTWTTDWTEQARGWRGNDSASVSAFVLGSLPDEMAGTADAALMIRAFHNLARFENDGGFLSDALDDLYRALKPGGVLGVVQHEARADMSDAWAGGGNGYLKKTFLIARIEQAGFEYLGSSDVNTNPADQPTESDLVWRLPPTLFTSRDDPELRARLEAVGESNRMTLKFRKPRQASAR